MCSGQSSLLFIWNKPPPYPSYSTVLSCIVLLTGNIRDKTQLFKTASYKSRIIIQNLSGFLPILY